MYNLKYPSQCAGSLLPRVRGSMQLVSVEPEGTRHLTDCQQLARPRDRTRVSAVKGTMSETLDEGRLAGDR